MVREDSRGYRSHNAYDDEGSERQALGSLSVATDARWQGTLTVPMDHAGVMFFHLERIGSLPAGYRGGEERAFFSLPISEADAIVALLAGLIAQARRHGVLT
jgi:hypothetical protein